MSAELVELLEKLLTKDPEKRIMLSEVREHPWVQKTTRTMPSKDENCLKEIKVSEEDIQAAIKPFYTPIHILVGCTRAFWVILKLYDADDDQTNGQETVSSQSQGLSSISTHIPEVCVLG